MYFSIATGLNSFVSAMGSIRPYESHYTARVSVIMAGKKRNNHESRAFKAKIADLKREGKTYAEICREMGVSRQYVSAVLIEAGLADGRKRRAPKQPEEAAAHVTSMIERLERKGDEGLAEMLRGVLGRNGKVKRSKGNGNSQG